MSKKFEEDQFEHMHNWRAMENEYFAEKGIKSCECGALMITQIITPSERRALNELMSPKPRVKVAKDFENPYRGLVKK